MNKNLNIKKFLISLNKKPNQINEDYINEPKIKEISIAPRMTSTMPLPFNNKPTDRILEEKNDYINEPKIKEISIAPRMTSTMPLPFNNKPTDRILENNFEENLNPKNVYIHPRMNTTMPLPFNNKTLDRIPTMDTFNPKNKY
jgi:hypothetical protein